VSESWTPAGGVPIARVLGIEVRVSMVWGLLIAIVALLAAEQAMVAAPGMAGVLHWLIGVAVALAFLATVVAHELAHAVVARHQGLPRTRILLGFIGGLAPLAIEARRPRDELLIAVAGPVVSLVIGGVATALAVAAAFAGAELAVLSGSLLLVGGLNLVMTVLSLLPGMPLDGGRMIRAIAWAGTGDADRASLLTARIGRVAGWGLVGSGVILAVADLVTAGVLALGMGWMLSTGAGTLARRLEVERLLRGATVADVCRPSVERIPPGLTVDTFAGRFTGEGRVSCLPVVDGERVLGVIGARQLRWLRGGRAATTRASEVMLTPPAAPFLAPDDDLWPAVELISRLGVDGLAVVSGGGLQGVVMKESIGELMIRRGAEPGGPGGGGAR
jgi:Zn-dependent protease/CBS domain-containing protein